MITNSKVINKWNGRTYYVVFDYGKTIKLLRDDGSEFKIQKSEYYFNYREVKDESTTLQSS